MKKIILKAVVKRDEKYLILLRAPTAKDYPEQWDFPGGNLEKNEEPLTGIEREVKEETGLVVKAINPVATYDEFEDDDQWHFTIYSTKIISGELSLSHEHTAFKWATEKEILALKTQPFITAYFQQAKT
ncbi:NUDIX hydrolase [Candidatus Woesearchaeota archaeon]|nr:NUDIX hydrolase [Candidatus Woesearchaeota archaeon]